MLFYPADLHGMRSAAGQTNGTENTNKMHIEPLCIDVCRIGKAVPAHQSSGLNASNCSVPTHRLKTRSTSFHAVTHTQF